MNVIRKNIPNAITCGNLLCGCLALVKAFEGNLVWAAYLVGIATVLDFFDGFAARMLRVTSPIGKDLDSLADMVTFGVVPGVVIYKLVEWQLGFTALQEYAFSHSAIKPSLTTYIPFIIPIFSAIRLAKFNNDTRQTESFIGLPTPANAIFFCSLPLIIEAVGKKYRHADQPFQLLVDVSGDPTLALLNNPWVLIALSVLFSFLLLAPLPLFSLKFKFFGWQGNRMRYTFLALSVALISIFKFVGLPLVIILYILLSIINNIALKRRIPK